MTNSKMLKNKILKYFREVKTIFKKGNIHFAFKWDIIEVFYYPDREGSFISQRISTRAKDFMVFRRIQDFCLDCYFEFERDGYETDYIVIAKILWVTYDVSRSIVKNIYKKIRRYGEKQLTID